MDSEGVQEEEKARSGVDRRIPALLSRSCEYSGRGVYVDQRRVSGRAITEEAAYLLIYLKH